MAIQRIKILGVPVDVCEPQELEGLILSMLEDSGPKQIMFLNIWDLMKARRKNEFAKCLENADFIIPISKSIIWGAKFLKKEIPIRYNPFNIIIRVLSILEERYKSFYLLGGRSKTLVEAEKNVKKTFPHLHLVGGFPGYFPKTMEDNIVLAIYKASPTLVLVSEGIKEKDMWSYNRKDRFSSSIFLYYKDAVGIFGGRINRVKEKTFEKGFEFLHEVIKNPFKIFLIFSFVWYIILLVWNRLFKKAK